MLFRSTFLENANGWKGILHRIDLLSCDEVIAGRYREHFEYSYSGLTERDWKAIGVEPDSLIPIGVTLTDRDVFALDPRRLSGGEARVVWLAGELIDEWPNFFECFASLIEYNKREMGRGAT